MEEEAWLRTYDMASYGFLIIIIVTLTIHFMTSHKYLVGYISYVKLYAFTPYYYYTSIL